MRCLVEFTLGAAVFRLHALAGHRFPGGTVMLAAGLALLLAGLALRWPDFEFALLAMLLVIIGLLDGHSFGARALACRPLLYVGEVSYSTYLVHYLVKDWSKFVLVGNDIPPVVAFAAYIGFTAAASVVLYYFVELPGRRLGRELVQTWLTRRQVA